MARTKKNDPGPGAIDNGIRVDLGTLADELRRRTDERDAIASERGRVSQKLKEADEAVTHAVAAIVAASRPGQTSLFAVPDRSDGDDEIEREEEVAAGVEPPAVLSGTTGAPIATTASGRALAHVPGEKYPRHESEERPGQCECGYSMTGIVVGHDSRHERYLLERDRERMIDVVEAPREKVASKRGPRDMTAAVAKRSKKTSAKKPPAKKKAARR